jgi:hypothetical protein
LYLRDFRHFQFRLESLNGFIVVAIADLQNHEHCESNRNPPKRKKTNTYSTHSLELVRFRVVHAHNKHRH